MSEIRIDPITGRHLIFAVERDLRPTDLWNLAKEVNPMSELDYVQKCPFCKGNESATPEEILKVPDSEDWKVRVFPNKFPAIKSMDDENMQSSKPHSIYEKYSGIGTHEVIVESPFHNTNYFTMNLEDFTIFIEAMVLRYKAIISNKDIEYVSFFKNHQKLAGASLFHPHSQLIGLNSVPDFVKYEVEGSKTFFDKTHSCPYCHILELELSKKERLIYENEHFAVICPFAPKYKYETWILPKKHLPYFETEDNIDELAKALYFCFKAMYIELGDFPFNMFLHALPKTMKSGEIYYHYHFEINPRLSGNAGFELGTGIYINSIYPEEAAKKLKEALEKEEK